MSDLDELARIRSHNARKMQVFPATYVSDDGGGWHYVEWIGSQVLASGFEGFEFNAGDQIVIARTGNQQVILSAPGASRLLSRLTDDFPGSEIDTVKWGVVGTVIVSDNRCYLDYASIVANESRIRDQNYILDSFFLKVEHDRISPTVGVSFTSIDWRRASDNQASAFAVQIDEFGVGVALPTIHGNAPEDSIVWDAINDAYIMVRQEGGNVAFRTSPDGLSWPRLIWSYPYVIGEVNYFAVASYYDSSSYVSHVNKV